MSEKRNISEMTEEINISLSVGDRFHYPEDALGISVDYRLKEIFFSDHDQEELYIFEPLSKTYVWKGQEYNFTEFSLKEKDVIQLLFKKMWIRLVTK